MSPIELLQKHIITLKRDLEKSKEMYDDGVIFVELHRTHQRNLEPLIKEYEQAIKKLLE